MVNFELILKGKTGQYFFSAPFYEECVPLISMSKDLMANIILETRNSRFM